MPNADIALSHTHTERRTRSCDPIPSAERGPVIRFLALQPTTSLGEALLPFLYVLGALWLLVHGVLRQGVLGVFWFGDFLIQ